MKRRFFLLFLSLVITSSFLLPCKDPRLNEKSEELTKNEILSTEIQTQLDRMINFCGVESDVTRKNKRERLVGLAAPQIGWMKRVVIIDIGHSMEEPGEFDLLINPKILFLSEERHKYMENCYSVPSEITGIVSRSDRVIIEALDREGKPIRREYSGYIARVAQHELDHLEGIRFPSRVEKPEELHIVRWKKEGSDYQTALRKNSQWHRFVDPNQWEALRRGNY